SPFPKKSYSPFDSHLGTTPPSRFLECSRPFLTRGPGAVGPPGPRPLPSRRSTTTVDNKRPLIYPGVALASSATLLFELTQTRLLSSIFWTHIVYLTVSLALLGFGISGTLVAIFSARRDLFTPHTMARLWMGFGLSMFGAVALTAWALPLLNGAPVLLKLGFCYAVYVVPFVFSGAILSVAFSRTAQAVGRLYATDLLFAGLACALYFLLLPALGAPKLVCVLGALALVLGALWGGAADRTTRALCQAGAAVLVLV